MVRYFAVSAMLVALAPFQWSAKPLPQTMKTPAQAARVLEARAARSASATCGC